MTATRREQETDDIQRASMSRLDEPTVDDDVAKRQRSETAFTGLSIETKTMDEDEAISSSSGSHVIDEDIESNNKHIQTVRRGLFPMNERQLAYEPPKLSRCACVTLILLSGSFIGGAIVWFVFSKDLMEGGED